MGRATFLAPEIPMSGLEGEAVRVSLEMPEGPGCRSPPCPWATRIAWSSSSRLDESDCRRLGPRLENHPRFPNRTNVQFARVTGRDALDILIWERGAGFTLASGSSSCGAAAAAVRNGLCDHGRVLVRMPGGELAVHVRPDWSLRLEGPVEEVYTGTSVAGVRRGLPPQGMKRICVFAGSSTGVRPEYAEAAQALAGELARRGLGLVYGGGSVGLMGVLADAALAQGVEVIGVIPRPLATRELAHSGLSDLRVVGSMHERKATMASLVGRIRRVAGRAGHARGDAGGAHVVAARASTRSRWACSNVAGYFDPLLSLLTRAAAEGFVRRELSRLCSSRRHARRALLDAFAAWRPPTLIRAWLNPRRDLRHRAAQSRKALAVASSMGKKHSIRISCRVTSCGVPSVAMVVKRRSETSPLRK